MRRAAALGAVTGLLFAVSTAAPAQAATQQVMMAGYAFSPAALTVQVGDTVTWMQHDQAPHDATTTSAPVSFHSPQLSEGQSWSYTFRTAGTYAYYCSVHPDMRATVTVLPAAATAPPQKVSPAPATRTPAKHQPATTKPATTTSAAAAAPPAGSPSASPTPGGETPAAPPPAGTQQLASAAGPTLDPMLLVAGLVTGIAVLCLLLLGSRRTS